MRIVGGTFRGRTLAAPAGAGTRPTSDRTRETIFNIIEHGHGGCAGAHVLDLFAGTGAMGLEALSRGAELALFVEAGSQARAALRTNIDALEVIGRTRIFKRDALRLGALLPHKGGPFGLVFCDPPYGKDLWKPALEGAAAGGWLAPAALVVLETEAGAVVAMEGFTIHDSRRMGDTGLHFLTWAE